MSPFQHSPGLDLSRRDTGGPLDDYGDFWWSENGQNIRWGIFGAIFLAFILYMVLGYWHAQRRMRKGLPPLAYHRWLLSRHQRAQFDPAYRDPIPEYRYYGQEQYDMHAYPLPIYDPNYAPPPSYQPPDGGSKVNPTQHWTQPAGIPGPVEEQALDYTPPPRPPPAATLHADQTGSSSTSNNPYRQ